MYDVAIPSEEKHMQHVMVRLIVAALSLAVVAPASAQPASLGTIDFPTSTTSDEAQAHFIRGTMLLHSFEWEDAAEAYLEAQAVDPAFVMAYWGEALSHTGGHHFSSEQDVSAARSVLSKLGANRSERLSKAATERERGYLEAVELLYGAGDGRERAIAYAERMEQLAAQFPDDREAATLYALSLMRSVRRGPESVRQDMQAGAIAQRIFRENPDHPGAAHYVIHAYDDPIHAPIGLYAALKYAEIAPAAVHALHMPSHMFVQLGMWDRLAASNEASFQASVDRATRKGLPPTRYSYHALYWLHYAYLQQGRLDKAQWCIDQVAAVAARSDASRYIKGQHLTMKARQMIVTERWEATPGLEDLVAQTTRDPANVDTKGTAAVLLAAGLGAVATGDLATAEGIEEALQALLARAASPDGRGGAKHLGIVHKEIAGLIRVAKNDHEAGLRLLEEAVEIADSMVAPSGPPGESLEDGPAKPAHELYGETLLRLDRPEAAAEAFEAGLLRMPRRPKLLLGAARAAAGSGEPKAARKYYQALIDTPGHESDLPGVDEASAFLNGSENQ